MDTNWAFRTLLSTLIQKSFARFYHQQTKNIVSLTKEAVEVEEVTRATPTMEILLHPKRMDQLGSIRNLKE